MSRLRKHKIYSELYLIILIFTAALFLVAYRIDYAPDIFTDEIIYARVGVRVSGEGALVWDSGETFLVHPPLFFLIEGLFFKLGNPERWPLLGAGDIFATVHFARHLNVLFAAASAVLLYLFGRKLQGKRFGALLVLLFILDPFSVRINRRAMLETVAGFFSLAGIYFFYIGIRQWKNATNLTLSPLKLLLHKPHIILAGLLMGLALLAKEITFILLVTVAVFGILDGLVRARRSSVFSPKKIFSSFAPSAFVIFLSLLTYLTYPLWVMSIGGWNVYSHEKILGLQRILGFVQLTGWNRPGISVFEFLAQRLIDYGSSFIILGLGGLATIWLLIWGLNTTKGRLLASWGLVQYPFFFFLAVRGSGNDQFYYFLLISAVVIVGYTASVIKQHTYKLFKSPAPESIFKLIAVFVLEQLAKYALPILIVLLLPFNILRWWDTFGAEADNGYSRLSDYVVSNLPPGTSINASGDPIKFKYFLPDFQIYSAGTAEEAQEAGINYFVLAPKDVQFKYGYIQPSLANWIVKNGEPLFSFEGDSYGIISLYRVGSPVSPSANQDERLSGNSHWRSFLLAKSGNISFFVILLILWIVVWSGMAYQHRIKIGYLGISEFLKGKNKLLRNFFDRVGVKLKLL